MCWRKCRNNNTSRRNDAETVARKSRKQVAQGGVSHAMSSDSVYVKSRPSECVKRDMQDQKDLKTSTLYEMMINFSKEPGMMGGS